MFIDTTYLLFALPGLILAVIAQIWLKAAYGSQSKVSSGSNLTGMQVAETLNEKENFGVGLNVVPGSLSDNFDPTKQVVNLSSDNVNNSSVANIAVICHEFGHVQQKAEGAAFFRLRSAIVPIVQFGSSVGYILFIIGLIFAITNLSNLGLILFSFTAIFALITLPVELDASRRGLKFIKKYHFISDEKISGARTVLTAAALTYVAGLAQSLGQLAYFLMLSQRRRD